MFSMKCVQIQEQLSAFHDGELPAEIHKEIEVHLAGCEACASRRAEFSSYTHTFGQISQPVVPPTVWTRIAAELASDRVPPTAESPRRLRLAAWAMALAASVLLMIGVGYWMARPAGHSDSHHADFALVMDHYLKTLVNDPTGAERFLLDKYNGQTVDPEDAIRLVGYRPAVASGLPDEYSLASTSVMTMPCCTCVKAVCRRRDGSTLVLFEHDDAQTEWFGQRPSSMTTCADKQCCLVDLDSSIAATWKRGSRWVTAVGVRDRAEVNQLVTWLEHRPHIEPATL
jgi:hypothetical protein